jgi:hypothetical protein
MKICGVLLGHKPSLTTPLYPLDLELFSRPQNGFRKPSTFDYTIYDMSFLAPCLSTSALAFFPLRSTKVSDYLPCILLVTTISLEDVEDLPSQSMAFG